MNGLDVVILLVATVAAVGGYRLGLVARATSWLGLLLGVALAAQLAAPLAGAMAPAPAGRVVLAAAALVVGGALLGQALGLLVGARLHRALPEGRARTADRSAGAVAGIAGVLVTVWLLAPAMAAVDGAAARLARNSAIARSVAAVLPPPPDAIRELQDLAAAFPTVFENPLQPAPELGPPPAESGLDAGTATRVATATVKVEGVACDRRQDGSGAVLGDELVVTNAHVVAGSTEVLVERNPDGEVLEATVVAFDAARDLAVLRVPGLDRAPLPLGDAEPGATGAAFGHPGGGGLELSPYAVAREVTATGRDIYGNLPTERQVLYLSSQLRPGDSGAALVDPTGSVVGVAFAIAPDDPDVAYALTIEEVRAVLASVAPTSAPVGTGACLP